MTDQTTHDVTDDDRRLARKWAESIESATNSVESTTNPWSDLIRAAVRVILDAVPTPPTLADMTLDEQDECTGMQADLAQGDRVVILDGTPDHDGLVQVLEKSLDVYPAYPAEVTPRPDLPRLEWPGDTPTGPDHLAVGAVIESADDPRLSALPVGSMLIDRDGGPFDVTKNYTGEWAGPGYVPAQGTGTTWGPWTVRRIGLEADQ